jgi:hypothetical protein
MKRRTEERRRERRGREAEGGRREGEGKRERGGGAKGALCRLLAQGGMKLPYLPQHKIGKIVLLRGLILKETIMGMY